MTPSPTLPRDVRKKGNFDAFGHPDLAQGLPHQFVLDLIDGLDDLLLGPIHVNLVVEALLDDAIHKLVNGRADDAPAVLLVEIGEIRPPPASEMRNGVWVMITSTIPLRNHAVLWPIVRAFPRLGCTLWAPSRTRPAFGQQLRKYVPSEVIKLTGWNHVQNLRLDHKDYQR